MYIWVRRTLDWDDAENVRANLREGFAPKMAVWDSTFHMPYREFRSELRRIAAANLEQVRGATVVTWEEIPEGAWVLPIDDDDWFSPLIAEVLQPRVSSEKIDAILWNHDLLEVPMNLGHAVQLFVRRFYPALPQKWLCGSNNYALRKTADNMDLAFRHDLASRWFAKNPRVVTIAESLSVQNRSLASVTSLGWGKPSIAPGALRRKAERYRKLYARYRPPNTALAWTVPFVEKMSKLMDGLVCR